MLLLEVPDSLAHYVYQLLFVFAQSIYSYKCTSILLRCCSNMISLCLVVYSTFVDNAVAVEEVEAQSCLFFKKNLAARNNSNDSSHLNRSSIVYRQFVALHPWLFHSISPAVSSLTFVYSLTLRFASGVGLVMD